MDLGGTIAFFAVVEKLKLKVFLDLVGFLHVAKHICVANTCCWLPIFFFVATGAACCQQFVGCVDPLCALIHWISVHEENSHNVCCAA